MVYQTSQCKVTVLFPLFQTEPDEIVADIQSHARGAQSHLSQRPVSRG